MIASLRGRVSHAAAEMVVLDVSGVGFAITCPASTAKSLTVGGEALLFTHLAVREDALTLFGFTAADDRDAFLAVQSVSGIGPRLALAIVSGLGPAELKAAILSENLLALSAINGVGRKTAQRLILEMKDKVSAWVIAPNDSTPTPAAAANWRTQVLDGLIGLGYNHRDAEAALLVVAETPDVDALPLPSLMRSALQALVRG
ncbi:MAG: Holliday junction branch migration protein RuvA [Propionibacteriaceae bacterium]|jgi:Holliday junction DNA helicase RuvA|nr:Holliday junction branch migration protein RuvA [Propionibacteriaceae bacterium]